MHASSPRLSLCSRAFLQHKPYQNNTAVQPKAALPLHQDFTVYRLYRGPQDCFNIMVAIWPSGGSSGVHDHAGKWVVEGVYRNKLHTIRYKRQDDKSRPGYAELRESVALDLQPGDVAHVLSPNEEIHDFINPTKTPTVSVHIYGGDISTETLNYFNPQAKTVEQVTHEIRYDNE